MFDNYDDGQDLYECLVKEKSKDMACCMKNKTDYKLENISAGIKDYLNEIEGERAEYLMKIHQLLENYLQPYYKLCDEDANRYPHSQIVISLLWPYLEGRQSFDEHEVDVHGRVDSTWERTHKVKARHMDSDAWEIMKLYSDEMLPGETEDGTSYRFVDKVDLGNMKLPYCDTGNIEVSGEVKISGHTITSDADTWATCVNATAEKMHLFYIYDKEIYAAIYSSYFSL